jgi:hypothetical protein
VRLIGRCVLWAGASYRPVRLMGRCVLWAGASYGPVRLIGWEIRYFDLEYFSQKIQDTLCVAGKGGTKL